MARTRPSATLTSDGAATAMKRYVAPPATAIKGVSPAPIVFDRYRAFVFPNRIREQRRRHGLQKLMALSELLPDIPYIRLSKIERGEVVARAGEVQRIAQGLGIAPLDLLSDVNMPGFDITIWAQPFVDGRPVPEAEERFAVMLAAALRVLRNADARLTIAALDQHYGLPPVILSRLENAHKTFDRWNQATIAAVCRLFDVANEAALRSLVEARYQRGELDGYVGRIADPAIRVLRTQAVIAALRQELLLPGARGGGRPPRLAPADAAIAATSGLTPPDTPASIDVRPPAPTPARDDASAPIASPAPAIRMLPVFGAPLPGGLIAGTPTDVQIEAPARAGPRAFGLRVCRATLGAGLPASATVVADPDRVPVAGGLAAIRSAEGFRLVSVTFDRMGVTKGYSVTPDVEINMDDLDPADVAAVIAAVFA